MWVLWLLLGAITGSEYATTARPGESWEGVGERFGVAARLLPRWNPGLRSPFQGGEKLFVSDVHVVPARAGDGIWINTAEGRLYLYRDGYPVLDVVCGVGTPQWPTPLGRFRVVSRILRPTWRPSQALQDAMRVPAVVPPGPGNPLGEHWLGIGGAVGIHGASDWQMPGQSHGCIRLRPPDAERLFQRAPLGTPVTIVHQTAKVALQQNVVYAEVHPARYPAHDHPELVWQLAQGRRLDPSRVRRAIHERLGLPVRISP